MERKQYLAMCKEVSTLKDGPLYIKIGVPEELIVMYEGIKYYPCHFVRKYKNGQALDKAVLHSLKANAAIEVDIEKVEVINNA